MLLVAGSAAVRVASLLSRVRTMSCILVARAFNLFCPPSMLTFFRRRLTFLCKRPSVQSLYRVPADRVGARVHFPLHSVLLLCRVWRRVRPRVSMDYQ